MIKQAIVAIEDKRFYEHRGVDIHGILRALWSDVTGGPVQGGSTITQQFVKNAINGERADDHAQAEGGGTRLEARAELDEGPDPDRVPEHDLLRERRLRRRGGLPRSTSGTARRRQPRRGGAPRRDPRGPEPLRPGRPPGGRQASGGISFSGRCTSSTTSTASQLRSGCARRCRIPSSGAPAGIRERPRPVLRELRHRPARSTVRREERVRRRAEGHDDDRPQPAEDRAAGDRHRAAPVDRAERGARRDRRPHGRRARDDRRPELSREPVQPRNAGRAPAGLGVQAVRAGRRAEGRHRPRLDHGLAPGRDRRRRPRVERHELRAREPRADQPLDRDRVLRQHRLRAAHESRRARRTSSQPRRRWGSPRRSSRTSRSASEASPRRRSRWRAPTRPSRTAATGSTARCSRTSR